MRPASAGPAVSTIWKLSRFSASPAGRSRSGSRLATNVVRAGPSTAASADCMATSAYSSHTSRSPANACAARAPDTAARDPLVISSSLRRSIASVTGPPSSPMARVGTIRATPMAPTANGERVSS
jgi:hypothetical protein